MGNCKTILFATAIAFSALASSAANAEDSIKIGVVGAMTGPYASIGEQVWRGASLAAEDINRAGGVGGRQLELVKGDDACDPKQAVAVANRLIDVDGVNAVIGHNCSSSTIPASEVYANADILDITPASTNPKITERGLENMIRNIGRDDQQGEVAASFIATKLKATTVAIVHDKDAYGMGLADAVRAQLDEAGIKVVLYEGLTRGEKDFNALVTKIKGVDADAVYFGGVFAEAGPLVKQLRDQGSTVSFISGDAIVNADFVTAAGGPAFSKGVYMTFGKDPRKIPEGKDVVDRFRAQGFEPEGYTLYAYSTLQAMAKAMGETKSMDGVELAKWLKSNSVDTVMGKKEWDDKGDLKVTDYVIYQWDDKGGYAEIE